MSELKAYLAYQADDFPIWREFYLKSEADKVIAEKDEKIEELEEHIGELQEATDSAWSKVNVYYDELCHSKYKRCLAMAEWCNANCMHTVLLIGHKIMPHWEWRIKTNYWYKWRKIWLELAEKFKEAK